MAGDTVFGCFCKFAIAVAIFAGRFQMCARECKDPGVGGGVKVGQRIVSIVADEAVAAVGRNVASHEINVFILMA
jgi:predicted alpha/beta-hydrolase family hydrolase